jgi:hypothetical protein
LFTYICTNKVFQKTLFRTCFLLQPHPAAAGNFSQVKAVVFYTCTNKCLPHLGTKKSAFNAGFSIYCHLKVILHPHFPYLLLISLSLSQSLSFSLSLSLSSYFFLNVRGDPGKKKDEEKALQCFYFGWVPWFTTIIPAAQQVEFGSSGSQPGQKS